MDIQKIRNDFPILGQTMNQKPLIYLDNAATTQKPRSVVEAITNYYYNINSNVHRGTYTLSMKATEAYENARNRVKEFINAGSSSEILFTRGTTESINMLSNILAQKYLSAESEVMISAMEHHSNLVPWQFACEKTGASLRVIPISDKGEIIWDEFEKLITPRTKIISVTHISNALGTINPVKKIVETAKKHGIISVIDGAQGISHTGVDVRDIDCDFYCFSGHKLYGPTGIGVVFGKSELLELLPPYQGGGEMVDQVSFDKTTFNELPYKFEAGTPNISGAIGLASALDYISEAGRHDIFHYQEELLHYATEKLKTIDGLRIYGQSEHKASIVSFTVDGAHHSDIGMMLDKMGVAVRVGFHCAQPLMQRYGISGTVRASFVFYNTFEEIDIFFESLVKTLKRLK